MRLRPIASSAPGIRCCCRTPAWPAASRRWRQVDARLLVLDPVLPLSVLGPRVARRLGIPWVVVAHGAEITVPGRLPVSRALLGRVLRSADGVIAAGGYPLAESERAAGMPLANGDPARGGHDRHHAVGPVRTGGDQTLPRCR